MIVYIVRHTSVDVPYDIFYGQTDVPVREKTFVEEATRVKEKIATLSFDAVFTSPLTRCVRLATFCGYGDAMRDERLKELNFGDWEWVFVYELHSPEVENWFKHQIEQPTPNGESFIDMKARLMQFISEQKAKGYQRICLFAHGGIHLCAQMLHGRTFEDDVFMHLPPYGSVIEYEF